MRSRLLILVATVLVAAPCMAQAPRMRDSAGIRIVENRARDSTPITFRLGPTPLMNVGGVEFGRGPISLRAVQLSGGGLAVIDTARVHFFDSRGARIITPGTAGRGPPEPLHLNAVCLTRGDTIVTSDARNNRLALFDRNGKLIRTLPIPPSTSPGFNACLGDGTFILEQSVSTPGKPTVTSFVRMRTDGAKLNTIGPISEPASHPVSGVLAHAAGGDRIYLAIPAENQIRVLNASGALTKIIRTADPLKRMSEADITRRAALFRETAERTGRPMQPVPTHYRAFIDIMVGSDGWLWAEENSADSDAQNTWVAFDENGAMVGRLRLFDNASMDLAAIVIGFGRGTVLVRRRDKDGATYLTLYRLEKVSGEE